ncbi:MAG: hypothetical protein U0263_35930 [Polyangiaceae bacterium]
MAPNDSARALRVRRARVVTIVVSFLLSIVYVDVLTATVACSSNEEGAACSRDTDCKGDRVCDNGKCVAVDSGSPIDSGSDAALDAPSDAQATDAPADVETDGLLADAESDAEPTDAPLVDALADGPPVDATLVDAPPVDAALVDAPPVDAALVDAPPIDAPPPPIDAPIDAAIDA